MLTKKQYDLLLLIDKRLKSDGVPPSFEEMKEALGLKSKSGIHRLITSLEERHFIRRLPHKARAMPSRKSIAPKLYRYVACKQRRISYFNSSNARRTRPIASMRFSSLVAYEKRRHEGEPKASPATDATWATSNKNMARSLDVAILYVS